MLFGGGSIATAPSSLHVRQDCTCYQCRGRTLALLWSCTQLNGKATCPQHPGIQHSPEGNNDIISYYSRHHIARYTSVKVVHTDNSQIVLEKYGVLVQFYYTQSTHTPPPHLKMFSRIFRYVEEINILITAGTGIG